MRVNEILMLPLGCLTIKTRNKTWAQNRLIGRLVALSLSCRVREKTPTNKIKKPPEDFAFFVPI